MKFCHFWPFLQTYFWPIPGHKCRSRKIFGRAKDCCPKSPKLAESFVWLSPINFLPLRTLFWVWSPKKGFMYFSASVGHHCLKSNNVGWHFCPDLQVFCPDFNKSKHLGCGLNPSTPASYTTAPGKSTFGPCLKKSFRRPCLGVHAHLPKCRRGTWPEKVWKPLHYSIGKIVIDFLYSHEFYRNCCFLQIFSVIESTWMNECEDGSKKRICNST